jgi:hypothetical protein
MGASRFGGKAQEVNGFHGFTEARQAMRATTPQVLAEIQGTRLRERPQQPQLVEFF